MRRAVLLLVAMGVVLVMSAGAALAVSKSCYWSYYYTCEGTSRHDWLYGTGWRA